MNKILFAPIISLLLAFPAISMACENSTAMPPGEFSEGVVSKIKMLTGEGLKTEVVYTVYLSSYRTVPAGQAVSTCSHFFVVAFTSPPPLNDAEDNHSVQFYAQQEIVKTLKTAFALNLHIQGSVKDYTGSASDSVSQFSPAMSRNDFLSYSKRP